MNQSGAVKQSHFKPEFIQSLRARSKWRFHEPIWSRFGREYKATVIIEGTPVEFTKTHLKELERAVEIHLCGK